MPLIALAASAVAGFSVQGWIGVLIWPLGLCSLVVLLVIAWVILRVVVSIRRTRSRVRSIQARIRPLSDEQLIEIMRTPTHPDSQFALLELMRRGVNARPTKDQLFGMLTSGNPKICGDAMGNLEMFYPEVVIPEGASNLDSAELWQSRVAGLRQAG